MKPSEALGTHRTELREIVTRHGALRPRVFGSAISGNDTDESDLDLLVDPTPQATLLTLAAIQPPRCNSTRSEAAPGRTRGSAYAKEPPKNILRSGAAEAVPA
jgi:hypothetical protein